MGLTGIDSTGFLIVKQRKQLVKLQTVIDDNNTNSHLRVSHKAESVESILAAIEEEVNASELMAA